MTRNRLELQKKIYNLKNSLFSSLPITSLNNFNEFDLSIPSKPSLIQKIFPNNVLFVLLCALLIKLIFFIYSLYCYQNGILVASQNVFNQFAAHWWDLEGLSDFAGDYIPWHTNWMNGEKLYTAAFKGRYLYPPLYYYLIHIFAYWTVFSAPIVIFLCNILTGYFVFRLALNFGATPKAAKIMMVLCLLSPFNLFYSDFVWQNTGVVTTFLVVSMFNISQENYKWGMFWLGVAMSIKQVAFFFYPFLVIGVAYSPSFWKSHLQRKGKLRRKESKIPLFDYIRNLPLSSIIFYGLIPIEIFLIASYPYIFDDPGKYISILFNNHRTSNYEWVYNIFSQIVPVNSNSTFIGYFPDLTINPKNRPYQVNYRTSLAIAFAWIGYVLGIPPNITATFAVIFHMQLFLYVITIILGAFYWWFLNRTKFSSDQEYYWFMWNIGGLALFTVILFAEIGIYKYYLVSLTPFWAMYGGISPLNHERWKKAQKYSIKEIIHVPSRIQNQLFGGGSYFHIIEQSILQIAMILFNKWLAVIYFYLPLYLLGLAFFLVQMFREEFLSILRKK
ncbi:MAG: glycosyltransferase 87 family protein [Candidatus Lokiarchaeota archaeon]|nr:glycosyltransferase 87 family protein [Candidatus Harpocratesius repetitus]